MCPGDQVTFNVAVGECICINIWYIHTNKVYVRTYVQYASKPIRYRNFFQCLPYVRTYVCCMTFRKDTQGIDPSHGMPKIKP